MARWHDPHVESTGHAVSGDYVELFWLPVLGPTSSWLLRRLVAHLPNETHRADHVDIRELAASLGVAWTPARPGVLDRAVDRCLRFGACRAPRGATTTLDVRTHMPTLPLRHVARLPAGLRIAHDDWTARASVAR